MGNIVYIQFTGPEAAEIMYRVLAGEEPMEQAIHNVTSKSAVGFQPNPEEEPDDDDELDNEPEPEEVEKDLL